MTKSERGFALIDCVGGAAITYAGYLASTGGDLILALVLLTFGMIPTITNFLTSELKFGLRRAIRLGTLWTLAVPTSVVLVSFALSFRWEQDAWFIQPVLHWTAIVLTGLVGTGYSIVLLAVVSEEIVDASKTNRHPSI